MDDVNMGFNRYCGPAVLSIMTGYDTDECAYRISAVNGQYKVTGVELRHLKEAGERMGVKFKDVPALEGRSIFFAATVLCKFNSMWLAVVGNHYIMLQAKDGAISLCDNHTVTPIDLRNSSRLSQKIVRLVEVDTTNVKPPAPKPPPPTEVSYKIEAVYSHSLVSVYRAALMSDNSIKRESIGSLNVYKFEDLQEVAFQVMELTRNHE